MRLLLPPDLGEKYAPNAALTTFQTVSEGEFSEDRLFRVLGTFLYAMHGAI
jgi:hypothetical protein